MNAPTVFVDNIELVLRSGELPDANWGTGMDYAASNACGIGVATANPNLEESLPSWTLLDQDGAARTPQVSQVIGGGGPAGNAGKGLQPVEVVANNESGDGGISASQEARLVTLAAGWVGVTPP
jgi:hypothetical protein